MCPFYRLGLRLSIRPEKIAVPGGLYRSSTSYRSGQAISPAARIRFLRQDVALASAVRRASRTQGQNGQPW